MSETEADPQTTPQEQEQEKKPFEPIFEDRTVVDLLKEQLGKVFLIANPESFEEGGLGPEIRAGYYRGRLIGMGRDYLIVLTEFQHGSGKKAIKEPVKQYIPLERVKRVSMMRQQRVLHL